MTATMQARALALCALVATSSASSSGIVWTCADITDVPASFVDTDGSGTATPGDCLSIDSEWLSKLNITSASSTVGKAPGGWITYQGSTTCGGFVVTEIGASDSTSTSPYVPDITCPEGQVAVAADPESGRRRLRSLASTPWPQASVTTATTGRGVGVPVSTCKDGYEKSGALCYPTCRDGYYGSVTMCVPRCPSGWDDQGLVCAAHSYAPGSMARPWAGCPDRKPHNCAGICYEECRTGYTMSSSGCGFCRTDGSCPHQTTNVLGVCWKNTYDRGAGVPMSCASGYKYDAGLCYKACPSGAHGVGPLCYASCPSSWTRVGVWCFESSAEAGWAIAGIVIGSVVLVVAAAAAAEVAGAMLIGGVADASGSLIVEESAAYDFGLGEGDGTFVSRFAPKNPLPIIWE